MSHEPSLFGGPFTSFKLNQSGGEQIIGVTGVDTPIIWETIVWDTEGAITVPVTYLQPGVAGYYQLNAAVAFVGSDSGGLSLMQGPPMPVVVARGIRAQQYVSISAQLHLSATDLLALAIAKYSTGDGTLDASADRTWFDCHLLRED